MAVRDVPVDAGPVSRSIPTFVTDPVWSLRCWPVGVEVAGVSVDIPALPAADWLAVLAAQPLDLEDVFPGLAPDGPETVDDLLFSGALSLDELYRIILDVITTVTGRPWWIAMRLITSAVKSWSIVGAKLVLSGVDAERVSLSAWLDAVFMIIVEGTPEDQLTMFLSQLEFPPPGFAPPLEIAMERDAFMDAMTED